MGLEWASRSQQRRLPSGHSRALPLEYARERYAPTLKSSPTYKMQSRVLALDSGRMQQAPASPIALHPSGLHHSIHTSFPPSTIQPQHLPLRCDLLLDRALLEIQTACSFISLSLCSNVTSSERPPLTCQLRLHTVALCLLTLLKFPS